MSFCKTVRFNGRIDLSRTSFPFCLEDLARAKYPFKLGKMDARGPIMTKIGFPFWLSVPNLSCVLRINELRTPSSMVEEIVIASGRVYLNFPINQQVNCG